MESAKQDILERISNKIGYSVSENSLSPALRQSIATLAHVQRSLYTMRQIYQAESSRSNQNILTRIASRSERSAIERDGQEVQRLKSAIDAKIVDLSKRVLMEQSLTHSADLPIAQASDSGLLTVLKCPNCEAALPLPTNTIVKCDYCGGTISVQNLQLQLASIVQGI